MTSLSCSECGKGITLASKTGLCRTHALLRFAYGGEQEGRRSASNRKRFEDPHFRARQLRTLRAANNRAWNDPVAREKMIAAGRRNINFTMTPEARANWLATRTEAARKRTETMLADIPRQHREEYKILRQRLRSRDKAKAAILAKLTPLERQLHAIQNGASLVEMPAKGAFGR